ncbi:MAG: ATP-binding cassette domain-containing protein [Oscillospiraceae bacterium]|nr:ATP-binding cassette domain-containing protein [Oscillospiraceae bacterium]
MLKVENLCKSYGDFSALSDLNLEMSHPGVYALLGTNGAGKTTALRAMLGILAKDSGSVTWNGKPLHAANDSVGYLAEDRGLYPKYTIAEQLYYFAALKGLSKKQARTSVAYWLERLEISDCLKKTPSLLSKGNQQKVQLAAALISHPEILILDEPLSGLDPVNSELFKGIIREQIERDKYVLFSSHQMELVEEFCNDIVILHKSKSVMQGNLNELKRTFGRVFLSVKIEQTEGNILPLAENRGIKLLKHTQWQTDFKVTSQTQAQELLKDIVANDLTLIKYELREPRLHEIFMRAVGEGVEI